MRKTYFPRCRLCILALLTVQGAALSAQSTPITKEQNDAWEFRNDKEVFGGHPIISIVGATAFYPEEYPELNLGKEVELALRRNGVPIMVGEFPETLCGPARQPCGTLMVIIDAFQIKPLTIYSFRVEVRYFELMLPTRDLAPGSTKFTRAEVQQVNGLRWSNDSGLRLAGELSEIRSKALKLVDRFCLAYLRANPR